MKEEKEVQTEPLFIDGGVIKDITEITYDKGDKDEVSEKTIRK